MGSPTGGQIVTVNGKSMRLPAHCSIDALIERMAVSGRYAVEVNGEIVPRSTHAGHFVADGDVIEIVAAIGGG